MECMKLGLSVPWLAVWLGNDVRCYTHGLEEVIECKVRLRWSITYVLLTGMSGVLLYNHMCVYLWHAILNVVTSNQRIVRYCDVREEWYSLISTRRLAIQWISA